MQKSCSILNIPLDESHYKLLAIQKWQQLTIMIFDIFHTGYDPSTAHHKADLPVILIDYGKRLSYARTTSPEFRDRINDHVAHEHNSNGWDGKPPFFQDQTSLVPRTYYFPRSAYPDSAAAQASFTRKPRQNSSSTIMPVKACSQSTSEVNHVL